MSWTLTTVSFFPPGAFTGLLERLQPFVSAEAIALPLPCLPLWLTDDLAITLDLEASYEETCSGLRVA
jgi:hypothetical protein